MSEVVCTYLCTYTYLLADLEVIFWRRAWISEIIGTMAQSGDGLFWRIALVTTRESPSRITNFKPSLIARDITTIMCDCYSFSLAYMIL